MKIGVCFFDDPKMVLSGWASIDGNESRRISGLSDLDTDVMWVLNVEYFDFKKLNLSHMPNVYDSQYFRVHLKNLAADAGLSHNPRLSAEFLSRSFKRISDIAIKEFKLKIFGRSYRLQGLLQDVFMPDFARRSPIHGRSAQINEAIAESTQFNQALVGVVVPKGSEIIPVSFPKVSYAQWLLSRPLPTGSDWSEIKLRQGEFTAGPITNSSSAGNNKPLSKIIELGKTNAIFLKVSVNSMVSDYSYYKTFGAGSNLQRQWATLPEIIDMLRYSKVTIYGGFRCSLGVSEDLLKIATKIGAGREHSFSAGILLENVWTSLSTPLFGGATRRSTALGAYIRAYDRLATGRSADNFVSSGVNIGSYGSGRVMVYSRGSTGPIISRVASQSYMIPPVAGGS